MTREADIKNLLANMSHEDLVLLRDKPGTDQNLVGPYEHRAFARQWTKDNPFAALSLALGIPAYSLYKMLGHGGARSTPSMEEIKQGYIGLYEGLGGK